jgi:hypothetical protein
MVDCDERALAPLAVEALTPDVRGEDPPDAGGVARGLHELIADLSEGSVSAFARRVEIPKVTLWGWARGQTWPEFGALLRMCLRIGVAPSALLRGRVADAHVASATVPYPVPTQPARRSARRFDVEHVRRALAEELRSENTAPRSRPSHVR